MKSHRENRAVTGHSSWQPRRWTDGLRYSRSFGRVIVSQSNLPGAATVRVIRPDDWSALQELRLRALQTDPLAFGSTYHEERALADDEWKDRAARASNSPSVRQWVATDEEDRLLGTVLVADVEGELNIFSMWVDPEQRGKGVGGKLLDTGVAWARHTQPGRAIRLEVNPRQTAAVKLYESRGFRFTGADRPLGHTPGETRKVMVLPR